ncbi:hypothetical protein G6L37_04980 [Agrobacterium rubi]|nr:hypothetical protein [Agrobacterium rubi]NTF24709.1 hypothetical protein [Agrobacterium rubi]
MLAANRFMKNDRVEFDVNARTVHGVLVEDDEALKVMADGGRMKFTVPFSRLRFSSKLLPKNPPHAMDAWQIANFRELKEISSETTAYAAMILLDGAPAISVSNAGNGSPDRLVPINGDYGMVLEFRAAVRNWLKDHDVQDGEIVDEDSFWVTYKARQAPYGVLVNDAIDEHLGVEAQGHDASDDHIESFGMRQ